MKKIIILIGFFISSFSHSCLTQDSSPKKVNTDEIKTVKEKKEHFKSIVLLSIQEVHDELSCEYKKLENAIKNNKTQTPYYNNLKEKYKVNSDKELLVAIKPHPISIALAQAALESSWATSRFTKEANNLFGVWSFNENEPRIEASSKRGNNKIYLKKYKSIKESVRDYFLILSRNSNYKLFRKYYMETKDPFIIVKGLDKYSEKGSEYGKILSSMIKSNNFQKYDS